MSILHMPQGTKSDYASGNYSNKEFVFELLKSNPNNAPIRSKETGIAQRYPLSVPVPMIGTIFWKDEKGQTYPRRIRYAIGEDSIFVDKQTPDENLPNKIRRKVVATFKKGKFNVDGNNKPLLDFMMLWDINESKDGRDEGKSPMFRLVDNTMKARKAREADKMEYDVIKWCEESDFTTKIEPLASLIFSYEQMQQHPEEIRYGLKITARRDIVQFKAMLDDPKTERSIIMKQAIQKGIIVSNTQTHSLYWSDNLNSPISTAAPGQDVVKDFVGKSFAGGHGEAVFQAIKRIVKPDTTNVSLPPKEEIPEPEYYKNPKPDAIKSMVDTDAELMTLIKEGINKGVITKGTQGGWITYKGASYMKEAGMLIKIRENKILISLLKKDVGLE